MQRRAVAWGVVGLALLALSVRLFRLAAYPLWTDEIFSYNLARMGWAQLLTFPDQTPPLFVAMEHVWMGLGGTSVWWLRLPSVLAGVATVLVTRQIALRFTNRAGAWIAAILVALSVDMIIMDQQARAYALFTLLVALSHLCLLRLAEAPSRRREILYVAVTALMLYAHVYALFFLAGQQVWFLVYGRAQLGWKRWIVLQSCLALLWAPWLPILWAATTHVTGGFWLQPVHVREVILTTRQWIGFRPLAYLTGPLLAWAAWTDIKRRDSGATLVWSWLLFAVLVPAVISEWVPIYWPLYIVPTTVAASILIGRGWGLVSRWPKPWMAPVACALILGFAALSAGTFYATHQKEDAKQDWRGTFDILDGQASRNATVVMNTGMCVAGRDLPSCPYPLNSNRTDLRFAPYFEEDRGRGDAVTAANVVGLDPLVQGEKQVWVLYTFDRDKGHHILDELRTLGYHETGAWTLKRVELHRFELA